ncbi:MAG TPA: hypothetical protein VEK57_01005 [Thermoanaerobaculia bacterium]|nr:hypothetical protein [Thermoanaerobaculia bacterium]
MKRILFAVLALTLIAAAPADRTEFVFDDRIPADNQRMLRQALTEAISSEVVDGRRATVTIMLRVIEPQPDRHALVAP